MESNRNINPWNRGGGQFGNNQQNSRSPTNDINNGFQIDNNTGESKFLKASMKLKENIKKHLENDEYESSSEEEELQSDSILESILKTYTQLGDASNLGRTQKFLEDAFQSGAATCLICISTVKRSDAIWSCLECYCFFHINCIQRWAKDSIAHQKKDLEERKILKKDEKITWACPKCRKDYNSDEIPKNYHCFCGKTKDPPFQPWLVPHSCGEPCNKELLPKCGHECLLLCHPGPCPPCPKTVKSECYCRKSSPKPQRCSNRNWTCGKTCRRTLACGRHSCENKCHGGDCPPCPQYSVQQCYCGTKTMIRNCAQPKWHCTKVCYKLYDCGIHACKTVCHEGECGICPLNLERTCPCGKCVVKLPCRQEDTPTCGDTCAKTLDCGRHKCFQRCHYGKCGQCLERVVKSCRCGQHSKEVPCVKEFLCETKCKERRDCYVHTCNRKCCDGVCPPCEKICGKTLTCGNHKCESICHRGPCYPCQKTVQVSCRCGETKIIVPCGRGVHNKPPRCNKPCKLPSACHHKDAEPHNCHFGTCPPCKQVCGIKREFCAHFCKKTCHSAILPKSISKYDKNSQIERINYPCSECPELVDVTCLGGHEVYPLPCHRAFSLSCERYCGRELSCGIHKCQIKCHIVLGAEDNTVAGDNCQQCENGCQLPRKPGCKHKCPHACHRPPCPPCTITLKLKCLCGLNQVFVSCDKYNSASPDNKMELQNCQNQCPKTLPCGHRCAALCHSGDCPLPDQCKHKVKLTCACRRIKKDVRCHAIKNGAEISCDEICRSKAEEEFKKKEELLKKKLELELKKNQEELEKFEKKFQSRKKNKGKMPVNEEKKPSLLTQYWYLLATATFGFAVAYVYLSNFF